MHNSTSLTSGIDSTRKRQHMAARLTILTVLHHAQINSSEWHVTCDSQIVHWQKHKAGERGWQVLLLPNRTCAVNRPANFSSCSARHPTCGRQRSSRRAWAAHQSCWRVSDCIMGVLISLKTATINIAIACRPTAKSGSWSFWRRAWGTGQPCWRLARCTRTAMPCGWWRKRRHLSCATL